jgi:TolB-like protein
LRHNTEPVGVKQVAQELGVRYVLEGSVRKAATGCASPGN